MARYKSVETRYMEEREKLFLVMEYIEGRSLSAILREEQPGLPQVINVALAVVLAGAALGMTAPAGGRAAVGSPG